MFIVPKSIWFHIPLTEDLNGLIGQCQTSSLRWWFLCLHLLPKLCLLLDLSIQLFSRSIRVLRKGPAVTNWPCWNVSHVPTVLLRLSHHPGLFSLSPFPSSYSVGPSMSLGRPSRHTLTMLKCEPSPLSFMDCPTIQAFSPCHPSHPAHL